MGQGSSRELLKPHRYAELENEPRKANGPKMLKKKEMGQKSPQAMKWVRKSPK